MACRILKRVFNIKLALLQLCYICNHYVTTLDINKVFTFIKSESTLTDCKMRTVSHKLVCLITGQRNQTIKRLNLDYIKISSNKVTLLVSEALKTNRPSHHLSPIELEIFKDIKLCAVAHLKQFIKMAAPFKNNGRTQLLLNFVQPHEPVSTTTLSRCCVAAMKEFGINVNIFGSHSIRSASISKCKISGLAFKNLRRQQDGF